MASASSSSSSGDQILFSGLPHIGGGHSDDPDAQILHPDISLMDIKFGGETDDSKILIGAERQSEIDEEVKRKIRHEIYRDQQQGYISGQFYDEVKPFVDGEKGIFYEYLRMIKGLIRQMDGFDLDDISKPPDRTSANLPNRLKAKTEYERWSAEFGTKDPILLAHSIAKHHILLIREDQIREQRTNQILATPTGRLQLERDFEVYVKDCASKHIPLTYVLPSDASFDPDQHEIDLEEFRQKTNYRI
jgi:hypothetical protein